MLAFHLCVVSIDGFHDMDGNEETMRGIETEEILTNATEEWSRFYITESETCESAYLGMHRRKL